MSVIYIYGLCDRNKNTAPTKTLLAIFKVEADLNCRNPDKSTWAVHAAAGSPQPASGLRFLFQKGADDNAQDTQGGIPLFVVPAYQPQTRDFSEMVRTLLHHGASTCGPGPGPGGEIGINLAVVGREPEGKDASGGGNLAGEGGRRCIGWLRGVGWLLLILCYGVGRTYQLEISEVGRWLFVWLNVRSMILGWRRRGR